MLIFLLLEILHGWQCLGRNFLLIIVVVEPESSKTFNKILDFTEEIVSTTMIVTGVRCFFSSFIGFNADCFFSITFLSWYIPHP